MNDIIFIINSLENVSVNYNGKYLLELGFSFLLLKITSDNNFAIVQYGANLFANLTFRFSSEDANQEISANLFKRLTFTTSTLPAPFDSLEFALSVCLFSFLWSNTPCVIWTCS
jgi:hypothetical protein